ncbi:MAG TPA: hypothetical protein G4N92_05995 [Anaerolineae bacterium]|nr:hypothetical protein [Anaerolineae bacterium]
MPHWTHTQYPKALGPAFTKEIRKNIQVDIDEVKPEIFLLGNSVLNDGIDPEQFEALTGKKVLQYGIPGSASAYWYLVIKNNIVTASSSPEYLLLFFLDNLLTKPEGGVNGHYLPLIDEIADDDEQVLLQKAYINQLNPIEAYLDSHIPLFGERQTVKNKIDNRIKYTLPQLLLKCNKPCLDDALDISFDQKNMLPQTFQRMEIENMSRSDQEWVFFAQIDRSFLPDIIRLTNERGIKIVLVREKNEKIFSIAYESLQTRKYFSDLENYLTTQCVPLLDFSHDPALTSDLFHDEMHLNQRGKEIFTQLVADEFLSLFDQRQ